MIIIASLNLAKINKDKITTKVLKDGSTAKFFPITIFLNDDGAVDQYGQSGTIKESISLEERNAGVKPVILGNLKIVGNKPRPSYQAEDRNDDGDQIPF